MGIIVTVGGSSLGIDIWTDTGTHLCAFDSMAFMELIVKVVKNGYWIDLNVDIQRTACLDILDVLHVQVGVDWSKKERDSQGYI